MTAVREGDTVVLNFTGRLEDGTVFGRTEPEEPITIVAGSEDVIPGISSGVIGMEPGDERTVTIDPERGFGEWQEGLAQEVPVEMLPDGAEVGDQLQAQVGEQVVPMRVTAIGDQHATVDANHPLAGKTLTVDLKVESVEPGGADADDA